MASVACCSELAEDDGQDGKPGVTNEGAFVPSGVGEVGLSADYE